METEAGKSNEDQKWYQNPWFKRIGWAGFFFFLIKGLLWIALALLTYYGFLEF